MIRTVLDELEPDRSVPGVRDEDKTTRVCTAHRRSLDLVSRCANGNSLAELCLAARNLLNLRPELDLAPNDASVLG